MLAAGLSTRMGSPKVLLPWGRRSIVWHIVNILVKSSIEPIIVVAGGVYAEIENELRDQKACQVVYNPYYKNGEMIVSLKTGMNSLGNDVHAALIVLGDQPQIEPEVVSKITEEYCVNEHKLIIPSYQMKRGHPWLMSRDLFKEMLVSPDTLKLNEFLNNHKDDIYYLSVNTACILQDLDTPEDYENHKPKT